MLPSTELWETISGTPSAAGTFAFEVSVTDAHGSVKRASFSLEVLVLPELAITTTALPDAYRGSSYPGITVLQPGKAWVVYGGASAFPPGTPNTVAASSGRLALNNSGPETVTLRDASGLNVSEHSYETTQDNVSFNRAVDGNPYSSFVPHWDISPLQSSAGRRADGLAF